MVGGQWSVVRLGLVMKSRHAGCVRSQEVEGGCWKRSIGLVIQGSRKLPGRSRYSNLAETNGLDAVPPNGLDAALETSPRVTAQCGARKVVETARLKAAVRTYCGAVFAKSPAFTIVSLAGSM